jgi:hypothetical protein
MNDGRSWESISKMMLHNLIQAAVADGVFTGEAIHSITGSILGAKELRNWSSHGSAWIRNPDENAAATAIMLLVCYTGWLFPPSSDFVAVPDSSWQSIDSVDEPWWRENATDLSPIDAARRLGRLWRGDGSSLDEVMALADQIVTYGGSGAILNLVQRAAKSEYRTTILSHVVGKRFCEMLGAAGRGRARHVLELAQTLLRAGYPVHARSLRACLPRDLEAIKYYLQRSSPTFIEYLRAIRDVDPTALQRMFATQMDSSSLVQELLSQLKVSSDRSEWISNLVSNLPRGVARNLFDSPEFATILEKVEPYQLLGWLKTAEVRKLLNAGLVVDGQSLLKLIVGKLRSGGIKSVVIVQKMKILRMRDQSYFDVVIAELLAACALDKDSVLVQQVLWDVAQHFPAAQSEAIASAQQLLDERAQSISSWTKACMLGMLYAADRPPSVLLTPEEAADAVLGLRAHNWEILRAALACVRSSNEVREISAPILARARLILESVRPVGTELSEKLVSDIRSSLGVR